MNTVDFDSDLPTADNYSSDNGQPKACAAGEPKTTKE